jgi:hypothetical protein
MRKKLAHSLKKKFTIIEKIIEPTELKPDDWCSVKWKDGISSDYIDKIRTLH